MRRQQLSQQRGELIEARLVDRVPRPEPAPHPATIPVDLDQEATLTALDGVITSSFIRATKPA